MTPMADIPDAARRRALEAHGADDTTIDELLAYTAKPFGDTVCPVFPLVDEPHLEAWREYAAEAARDGAAAALRRHFVQMRAPIRAGISQEPAYLAATRKGQSAAADDEFAPGLALANPDGLRLEVVDTIAGGAPALIADDRRDFVALVQAFTERNEPVDVPPAMGACIVNGLTNWDRVEAYRARWKDEHADEADTGWGEEFRRFAARKELYQDRFIILSRGPYSGIAADAAGLPETDWLAQSLTIRREHECAHYFTYRVFRSMRNNVFDELIADFVGLARAFGGYRRDLAARFLGLETFPAIRAGSRLDVYRGNLSAGALATIGSLAVAATRNLQTVSDDHPAISRDLAALAQLTYRLYGLTFEELASPEMPALMSAPLT